MSIQIKELSDGALLDGATLDHGAARTHEGPVSQTGKVPQTLPATGGPQPAPAGVPETAPYEPTPTRATTAPGH